MMRYVPLAALAGCTWVAQAQYDDRAAELEAFRSEFLPAADRVQQISAADNRLYWISLEKPLDEPMLHSFDPATGTRVDYESTRADSSLDERYRMSGALVVKCNFSTVTAIDAATGAQIDTTNMGSELCAVDGRTVYFRVGRAIRKWTPGQGPPVQIVDLDAAKVGTGSVNGFGVLGNLLVLAEGGRLWRIAVETGTAVWLENEASPSGTVVFDTRGVLFDSNVGITYLRLDDHSAFLFDDALADGGYKLNNTNDDIHLSADAAEYAIHGTHVIYRGTRGIFAYGLESTKVIDLLLDRGEGFDARPHYRFPSVTADGTLFVLDNPSGGSSVDRPVYRVSLTGDRLR